MLPLAFLLGLATASPLVSRANAQCGRVSYTADAVQDAAQAACNSLNSEERVMASYPHRYNNYEGFDFPVDPPYNEFPILKSGRVYTSGPPGPDRVIVNDGCEIAGLITHTGAKGNNFVACSGTS